MIGATLSHYRTVKHRGIDWPMPPWCTLGANDANYPQSVTVTGSRTQLNRHSGKPLQRLDLGVVRCGVLLLVIEVNC